MPLLRQASHSVSDTRSDLIEQASDVLGAEGPRIHDANGLKVILDRLPLSPAKALALDVGGAAFSGNESTTYLARILDKPVHVIAAARPEATINTQRKLGSRVKIFPKLASVRSNSYDVVVVNSSLSAIMSTLASIPEKFLPLVKPGGYLILWGLRSDNLGVSNQAEPEAEVVKQFKDAFAPEGDAISQLPPWLADDFDFVMNVPRRDSSDCVSWLVLQRRNREQQKNSLQGILEQLSLSRINALVLDVGGAAFSGKESTVFLTNVFKKPVHVIAAARPEATKNMEKAFGKRIKVFSKLSAAQGNAYSVVVVNSSLKAIMSTVASVPTKFLPLVKPGGYLILWGLRPDNLGGGNQLEPDVEVLEQFKDAFGPDGDAVSRLPPSLADDFDFVTNVPRKGNLDCLSWLVLQRRKKEQPAAIAKSAPRQAGERYFLMGAGFTPAKQATYVVGRATPAKRMRVLFQAANAESRSRIPDSGTWKATVRCLDDRFNSVPLGPERLPELLIELCGSDLVSSPKELSFVPGKMARWVSVCVTTNEPARCVKIKVRFTKPAFPDSFVINVQAKNMQSIMKVAADLSGYNAFDNWAKKGVASQTITRTLWKILRPLIPTHHRDSFLEAMFGAATYDGDKSPSQGGTEMPNEADVLSVVTERVSKKDISGALYEIFTSLKGNAPRSRMLERLADVANAKHLDPAPLYWAAYGANASPAKAKKLSLKMFKGGDIDGAMALSRIGDSENAAKSVMGGELALAVRLANDLNQDLLLTPRRVTQRASAPNHRPKVGYVASSAQPWQITGYTVRTHELLRALRENGTDVECFLRPGYPSDKLDASKLGLEVSERLVLNDVPYNYSPIEGIVHWGADFMEQMASALVQQFERADVGIVHAASNNRTALPGLIAARRLGLPFIYEIRGLWELTAASRNPIWESSQRYQLDSRLERFIAQEADHVFTITSGVASELTKSGVPEHKISLLPNAVDPEQFSPRPPSQDLSQAYELEGADLVLVYAGSLTNYEGMDDVIEAIGILRERGLHCKFLVIGAGVAAASLQAQVGRLALESQVKFLGQITPHDIGPHLALADVIALPRKPFRVCEIVSPLKPFEAMAMGKPVILSNLAASRDIVIDNETGLLCTPADPVDLADKLERLARDPALRQKLGEAGRIWVTQARSWKVNAQTAAVMYDRLLSHAH